MDMIFRSRNICRSEEQVANLLLLENFKRFFPRAIISVDASSMNFHTTRRFYDLVAPVEFGFSRVPSRREAALRCIDLLSQVVERTADNAKKTGERASYVCNMGGDWKELDSGFNYLMKNLSVTRAMLYSTIDHLRDSLRVTPEDYLSGIGLSGLALEEKINVLRDILSEDPSTFLSNINWRQLPGGLTVWRGAFLNRENPKKLTGLLVQLALPLAMELKDQTRLDRGVEELIDRRIIDAYSVKKKQPSRPYYDLGRIEGGIDIDDATREYVVEDAVVEAPRGNRNGAINELRNYNYGRGIDQNAHWAEIAFDPRNPPRGVRRAAANTVAVEMEADDGPPF